MSMVEDENTETGKIEWWRIMSVKPGAEFEVARTATLEEAKFWIRSKPGYEKCVFHEKRAGVRGVLVTVSDYGLPNETYSIYAEKPEHEFADALSSFEVSLSSMAAAWVSHTIVALPSEKADELIGLVRAHNRKGLLKFFRDLVRDAT